MTPRASIPLLIAFLAINLSASATVAREPGTDRDRDGVPESGSEVRLFEAPAVVDDVPDTRYVVRAIRTPGNNCQGMTYDGTFLWVVDNSSDVIHQIDPADGHTVKSFDAPYFSCQGLAWDGTWLWVSENGGFSGGLERLYKLDPATGDVISHVSLPTYWVHGITWDGSHLWAADFGVASMKRIDEATGDLLASISTPSGANIGAAWDGTYLWTDDFQTDLLYQLDPSDGSVIRTLPSPHTNPRDLAWDGEYLWVLTGVDGKTIYQVDVTREPNIACRIEYSLKHHGIGTAGRNTKGIAQTFTACSDGVVTRVVVEPFYFSTPEATFGISNGDQWWSPVYTQEVFLNAGGLSFITLDVPFPVEEGAVYAFGLITPEGGELALWEGHNGYLGGESVFIQANDHLLYSTPTADLTFDLIVETDDDTPPSLSVELTPDVLWPPNHKLVDVHATVTVTDDVDPNPTFVLSSIACSENGVSGAGKSAEDCIDGADYDTPDVDFRLRAERSGRRDGRLYEVVYRAQDASGNAATETLYVRVPHDQRSSGPQISAGGDEEDRPLADRLSVEPNPFNPTTNVRFQVAQAGPASVRVYDVHGALVRTLCDEIMGPGTHEVRWSGFDEGGRRVSSGIYFVRLVADRSSVTRKIVLLK